MSTLIARLMKGVVAVVGCLALSACGGPLGMLAGGALDGATAPFTDAVVPGEAGVIQLETRPDDPYSVNIGFTLIDGHMYMDPAAERSWYQNIKANPDIRVRFDGTEMVYTARAYPVSEASILAQFEADRIVLRIGPRS